jgi:chromosome segregation ATPase
MKAMLRSVLLAERELSAVAAEYCHLLPQMQTNAGIVHAAQEQARESESRLRVQERKCDDLVREKEMREAENERLRTELAEANARATRAEAEKASLQRELTAQHQEEMQKFTAQHQEEIRKLTVQHLEDLRKFTLQEERRKQSAQRLEGLLRAQMEAVKEQAEWRITRLKEIHRKEVEALNSGTLTMGI